MLLLKVCTDLRSAIQMSSLCQQTSKIGSGKNSQRQTPKGNTFSVALGSHSVVGGVAHRRGVGGAREGHVM